MRRIQVTGAWVVVIVALGVGFLVSMFLYPIVASVLGIIGLLLLTNVSGARARITGTRVWGWLPWLGRTSPILAGMVLLGWAALSSAAGYAAYSSGARQVAIDHARATQTASVAAPITATAQSIARATVQAVKTETTRVRAAHVAATATAVSQQALLARARATGTAVATMHQRVLAWRRALVSVHATATAESVRTALARRRARGALRAEATATAKGTATATALQQVVAHATAAAQSTQAAGAAQKTRPSGVGTPGPVGPLNPRPGLGASKQTLDRFWTVDNSSPCTVDAGCMYIVQGLELGATFIGSDRRVNHIDVQVANKAQHADIWQFEQSILPAGATLAGCKIITPSDQGGPVKGCVYTWEGRQIVLAEYLDPSRPLADYDGIVEDVIFAPYDSIIPGKGKVTMVTTGPGEASVRPQRAVRAHISPTAAAQQTAQVSEQIWAWSQLNKEYDALALQAIQKVQDAGLQLMDNKPGSALRDLLTAQPLMQQANDGYSTSGVPPGYEQIQQLVIQATSQDLAGINDMIRGLENQDDSLTLRGEREIKAGGQLMHQANQELAQKGLP